MLYSSLQLFPVLTLKILQMGQLVYHRNQFLATKLLIPVMMDYFLFLVIPHVPVKLMDSGQEVNQRVVSNCNQYSSAITILLEQICSKHCEHK